MTAPKRPEAGSFCRRPVEVCQGDRVLLGVYAGRGKQPEG